MGGWCSRGLLDRVVGGSGSRIRGVFGRGGSRRGRAGEGRWSASITFHNGGKTKSSEDTHRLKLIVEPNNLAIRLVLQVVELDVVPERGDDVGRVLGSLARRRRGLWGRVGRHPKTKVESAMVVRGDFAGSNKQQAGWEG